MTTVRIYRATSERQVAECQALDSRLFPKDDPYKKRDAVWWIAELEGEVVGYAAAAPVHGESGVAWLARAGVAPKARGQGLQRRLIRVRERWAKRLGFNCLLTYTDAENMPSANNLLACGFRLYRPHWKWGCVAALYFKKALR